MLNRIVLIGRLTRDPSLRYTNSGLAVCSMNLAVDRKFKNAAGEKETDFIDIVAWRQLGENCANYLSKGKLAAVEGSMQIRSYEDKDGNKRRAAEVLADSAQFLSPRENSQQPAAGNQDTFWSGTDEDLPF